MADFEGASAGFVDEKVAFIDFRCAEEDGRAESSGGVGTDTAGTFLPSTCSKKGKNKVSTINCYMQ